MTDLRLEQAYRDALALARRHYENFPVASWLLPKRLRRPISVIYAFARSADDFADEGNLPAGERLALLDAYAKKLDDLAAGRPPSDPLFIALADSIQQHQLPLTPFYDLLTAFRMDVTHGRYASHAEVLNYCRYSANPVGRLLLYLCDAASPENLRYADAICSALQLINFLQDISQDYQESNRIYLPQDEMAQYGVSEMHIKNRISDAAMRQLLQQQIKRSRALLLSGWPLGGILPGRMGLELRATIAGGLRILQRLESQRDDVFSRPRLRQRDWLWIFWQALIKGNAQ